MLSEEARIFKAEADPSAKLAALTSAMRKACKVAVPMKVERRYSAPLETKVLRGLIRLRYKHRRDILTNCGLWIEVSKRPTELTIQNQRKL